MTLTDRLAEALRECPFCGGEAAVRRYAWQRMEKGTVNTEHPMIELTSADLDAMEKLASMATPGSRVVQWGRGEGNYPLCVHNHYCNIVTAFGQKTKPEAAANAELVAMLDPSTIQRLIALARRGLSKHSELPSGTALVFVPTGDGLVHFKHAGGEVGYSGEQLASILTKHFAGLMAK